MEAFAPGISRRGNCWRRTNRRRRGEFGGLALSPDGKLLLTTEELPGESEGAPRAGNSLFDLASGEFRPLERRTGLARIIFSGQPDDRVADMDDDHFSTAVNLFDVGDRGADAIVSHPRKVDARRFHAIQSERQAARHRRAGLPSEKRSPASLRLEIPRSGVGCGAGVLFRRAGLFLSRWQDVRGVRRQPRQASPLRFRADDARTHRRPHRRRDSPARRNSARTANGLRS